MLWSVGTVLVIRHCFYQLRCVCKFCVFLPRIATYDFSTLGEKAFIFRVRFDRGVKVKIDKGYHVCVSL